MARLVVLARPGMYLRCTGCATAPVIYSAPSPRWPGPFSPCLRGERAAMKALIIFLLIASLLSIRFIMPVWCSVPHIDQYITRCGVYRI